MRAVRSQAERYIDHWYAIRLDAAQDRVKADALEAIKAPCCSDYTMLTCCCPCNLAKSVWGLSHYLVAKKGYTAPQVKKAVLQWLEARVRLRNERDAAREALETHIVRRFLGYQRAIRGMVLGWGIGERALPSGARLLRILTRGQNLENGRIPVAVCATELRTGTRAVLRSGSASQAVYARSALAGILPPLRRGGQLLCDGAYADIAPIDVARSFGHPAVAAVDAGQALASTEIRNGFQALTRAVEICQMTHADRRFEGADFVLRPEFGRAIDTLDFDARRVSVAAGVKAVRKNRAELRRLLGQTHRSAAAP